MGGIARSLVWLAVLLTGGNAPIADPYRDRSIVLPRAADSDATAGVAAPPLEWPAPDALAPDTGAQSDDELVRWLGADDRAQRLEACVRLGPHIRSLIPQLEHAAHDTTSSDVRSRIVECLAFTLEDRDVFEPLRPYPTMAATAAELEAGAHTLVAPWERDSQLDDLLLESYPEMCGNGAEPEVPLLNSRSPRLDDLLGRLRRLRPLALPAVETLLRSERVAAKFVGLFLVVKLGLEPGPQLLSALRSDQTTASVLERHHPLLDCGPVQERPGKVSVSDVARALGVHPRWVDSRSSSKLVSDQVEMRIERLATSGLAALASGMESDLINGLRQLGGVRSARTEQEYWNLARPGWRLWWATAVSDRRPYDRAAWTSLQLTFEGIQIAGAPRRDGRTEFVVVAPEGTQVEVVSERSGKRNTETGSAPFRVSWVANFVAPVSSCAHVVSLSHYVQVRLTDPPEARLGPKLTLGPTDGVTRTIEANVPTRSGAWWDPKLTLGVTEGATTTVWVNVPIRRRWLERIAPHP